MAKRIKYLIIDDERLAREELKSMLREENQLEFIGEAQNAFEGIDLINNLKPDLVFLDIQMPGMTGIGMLKELKEMPHVVFTTAYDEFAVKAFELDAMDYILKPIDPNRLDATIRRVLAQDNVDEKVEFVERERLFAKDKLFLKEGEKCFLINIGDIKYFESDGNYVKVNFENEKVMVLKSLNLLEKKLDENLFFRINRQYIINLKFVNKIEPWFNGGLRITLIDGEHFEMSRRQSSKFREFFSV